LADPTTQASTANQFLNIILSYLPLKLGISRAARWHPAGPPHAGTMMQEGDRSACRSGPATCLAGLVVAAVVTVTVTAVLAVWRLGMVLCA
jgi:hypothetical protein